MAPPAGRRAAQRDVAICDLVKLIKRTERAAGIPDLGNGDPRKWVIEAA